ncbi:siderophore-interacting protein [uncultured Erythrobacter sp.]|uniref:siderophore-interacting protein n=1 Tax=uncultured Erythrobacter sp. TaxID=263913 RepID=UPI002636A643|nr:siderophore-interacting protein [uncultured Erythrobacter sp.]
MVQAFYNLKVASSKRVSPSMHQITLAGEALRDFPQGQEGGYFKLILEPGSEGKKALMRTYTIRRQRETELDVLFALHGGQAAGPATGWALEADLGDSMTIRGPGPAKPPPENCGFYLIAGDMSALPAVTANLEAMHRDAKGVAALEIQNEEDAIAIDAPDGIELRWIVNPEPGHHPELLANALREIELPDCEIAGWAACEFEGMKLLRAYLRDELGLASPNLYISSYWKLGLTETQHKVVKREDADEQEVPIQ